MPLAAITVLTALDSQPVNKIVTRAPDGTITKSMARHSHRFRARTVPVPDLATLAAVLREVGERPDTCISLSVFKDPPAEELSHPAHGRARRKARGRSRRQDCARWLPRDRRRMVRRAHPRERGAG